MPTAITNVQVTKDGTDYIQNGQGNLHDDHDANSYIIINGGIRPNALVKGDKYRIEYDETVGGVHRIWQSVPCEYAGGLAQFQLVL